MNVGDDEQAEDHHENQRNGNGEDRVDDVGEKPAAHRFAVASQWRIGTISRVAVEHVTVENDRENETDQNAAASVSQRALLSARELSRCEKPPVDGGERNQPESDRSRAEHEI